MDLAYSPSRTIGTARLFSGVVPTPEKHNDGIKTQTRDAYRQISEMLASERLSLNDVVYVTAYLSDPDDFAAYDAVWRELFPTNPPARTTVSAQLLVPGARVELSVIAHAS